MCLLEVLRLDTRGDRHDPLGAGVAGGRVVAQGQLLPHVHKQLGIAGAAEDQVRHDHGGHIVGAAAPAHGQLALGHVHLLGEIAGLLRRGDAADGLTLRHHAAGQRGKRTAQRALHPLLLCAAAVEHLHAAGGQQLTVVVEQLVIVDLRGGFLVAQTQHAVRLSGAHLLHQPHVGPILLVVADGSRNSSPSRSDTGSSSFSPAGAKASSITEATKPMHWRSPFLRTV